MNESAEHESDGQFASGSNSLSHPRNAWLWIWTIIALSNVCWSAEIKLSFGPAMETKPFPTGEGSI